MISRRVAGLAAGFVLGGLLAGWLVREAVHMRPRIRPEIRRTPVIGLTLPRSPSPTPTVTYSDGADMPPAPAVSVSPGPIAAPRPRVQPVGRVAAERPTVRSSIEPREKAARTPDTSASDAARRSSDAADPHAVIDWLLDPSSRGR